MLAHAHMHTTHACLPVCTRKLSRPTNARPCTCLQILPITSLNINQHNVRMALVAASAALSEPCAVPAKSCPGLRALTNRGASTEQLLEQGEAEGPAVSGFLV